MDQGHSTLKILLTAVHNLTRVMLRLNKQAGSALEKTHIFDNSQLLSNSNTLCPLKPFSRGAFVTHWVTLSFAETNVCDLGLRPKTGLRPN